MADSQPVACMFFRLPPSQQLFTRIHDIPWLILLPELDKLTTALETLLLTNPSTTLATAMKTLLEARKAMGRKMIPLRDAMLSGRDFSRQFFELVDNVLETRFLSQYVKRPYTDIALKAAKKAEKAQQALTEFREELEGVVFRIMSSIGGDDNNVSLFIGESSQIVSTMVTAIEECKSILQESTEMFRNFTEQDFDPEAYEHNPPSDEECQLVSEKWQMLENHLHGISLDWNRLALRIEIPHFDVPGLPTYYYTPEGVRNAVAPTDISKNPVKAGAEAPPNPSPSDKAEISFWQKILECLSLHFSLKRFR